MVLCVGFFKSSFWFDGFIFLVLPKDRAKDKENGKIYALKKILMHRERDGLPITALRGNLIPSTSHLHRSLAVEICLTSKYC